MVGFLVIYPKVTRLQKNRPAVPDCDNRGIVLLVNDKQDQLVEVERQLQMLLMTLLCNKFKALSKHTTLQVTIVVNPI